MKYIICIMLLLVGGSAWANGNFDAPAGLQWGEKGESLIQKYQAVKVDVDSPLELYEIKKPPILPDSISEIYGTVDKKYGLVRVILIKVIHNDAFGHEGIESYKRYKKILSDKYGKPESYEYSGRLVYKNKSEFYECLAYEGCGGYSSFFSPSNDGGLYMMLKGYRRGEGELRIIYESKEFNNAQKEIESISEEKDKAAL
ncbi:hypothetical protein KI485_000950 [Salmonella enterica subsp. enterica serovar Infantis]|uniref:Uncharacterized protein n=2 Tax=Salmonella enterica TaxID=28901 RepID=A0A5Y2VGZ9_SALER|nr:MULTISPECIES: hypothetical protein [Enterobacteriaceae]EAN3604054.1 hypothetical protein [Salmonella enterica]EAX7405607.1 hypothetical protein [Salmonella enterica subsp. enterica serovar Infantis]ECD7397390.1 hypothetical protein [Salmonella enterica subsp. enterica serovar Westhampton]ECJ6242815.1 hypothetical protein [Salmonella enterica subsp. enterica]EDW2787285.1 hypothetical protein [Salmonella enterica subsp. enterica serovar Oranienburg]EEE6973795.1 hypothetical protein [Salmonel